MLSYLISNTYCQSVYAINEMIKTFGDKSITNLSSLKYTYILITLKSTLQLQFRHKNQIVLQHLVLAYTSDIIYVAGINKVLPYYVLHTYYQTYKF